MRVMLGLVLCIAAYLPLSANAAESFNILKYNADKNGQVLAFNESGKRIGKVSVSDLPQPEFAALAFDSKTNRVKISSKKHGNIWLLSMQVKTSRRVAVKGGCGSGLNNQAPAGKSHISRGLGGPGC